MHCGRWIDNRGFGRRLNYLIKLVTKLKMGGIKSKVERCYGNTTAWNSPVVILTCSGNSRGMVHPS